MDSDQQAIVEKIFDSSTSVDDLKWEPSFRTQQVLREIINIKNNITSPLVAAKVAWFFWKFAFTNEGRKLATTREVNDVIINHCAKHATTSDSFRQVALAIGNITANNSEGQRLFSTAEMLALLVEKLEKFQYNSDCLFAVSYALFSCGFSEQKTQQLNSTIESILKKILQSKDSSSLGGAIFLFLLIRNQTSSSKMIPQLRAAFDRVLLGLSWMICTNKRTNSY
jgi:hypothetical protein